MQVAIMMEHNKSSKLTAHEERVIAVDALVDPRTVRKALAGGRVNPMALARIRTALELHGLADLLPDDASPEQAAPDFALGR
jgi:hypothetical protein